MSLLAFSVYLHGHRNPLQSRVNVFWLAMYFTPYALCTLEMKIVSAHYINHPELTLEIKHFSVTCTFCKVHAFVLRRFLSSSLDHTFTRKSMSTGTLLRLAARSHPSRFRKPQPTTRRLPVSRARGSVGVCCQFSTTPSRASGGAGDEEESFEQFTAR